MKTTDELPAERTERLLVLRQRAQEVLRRADPGAVSQGADKLEVAKLLEDLRIYQVELELQNEELRSTQQEAELARRRYQNLFEQLPIPALVVDVNGIIDDCNEQANAYLGTHRRQAGPDSRLWTKLSLADRDRLHAALHSIGSGHTLVVPRVPIGVPQAGAPVFDVHLMGLSIQYKLDRRVLMTLVDRSAELARARDQRFYSLLLDSSDSLVYATDQQGQMLLANQTFLNLLGRAREEVLGRKRESFLPLRDAILHNDTDRRVLRSAQRLTMEEQTQPDLAGPAIDLLTHKFPLFDEQGKIYGVGGISTDITELKNQQRQAMLSEAVFMGAQEAIIITDEQTRIIRVNPAFVLLSGFSPESVIGRKVSALKSGQQPKSHYEQMWQQLQRHGRWSGEFHNRRADGSEYTVWSNINAMTDASSGKVLHYIGISIDISQRKEAERERLRSAELMRAAIDAIDEAFVLYDAQDRLVLCNDKYRSLYARSSDLIQPGATFEHIIREGAQRGQYKDASGRVDEWVAERMAAHRLSNSDVVQHLDDGRVVRVMERRLSDGHTVGFRVDITDLVHATEEAQAANLAKSRFLATMSHEIRTPMNGILGMAQMLLMPELAERERFEYARTIFSSGQTLLALLNDILDLSKIEAGKFQLESAVFEPEAVLREVCTLFSGAAQAKELKLDYQWQGQPGQRMQSDAYRLRQMLSNLVGNAIKFTHSGSIRVQAGPVDGPDGAVLLEFSVTDSGVGVPTDRQALLFKPFSQADSSTTRQFGGTGLGLSIVRHLARAMGGDVGVQSAPGQGSRFWFKVAAQPIEPGQETRAVARAEPEPSSGQAGKPLQGHVLVAEDNPVNCIVIESLLARLGVTVTLVHDGQQALDAVMQSDAGTEPDLILMDLQMPVLDGYAAATQIRQWESARKRRRHPIIALTADAFEEDHQHCLAVGMDDFLTKPIAFEVLQAALERWLHPKDTIKK